MRVFVSFDERYDTDLYEMFVADSLLPGSTFEVVHDGSSAMQTKGWSGHPRTSIRRADQVVFLCGEHTDDALRMSLELDIAREETKPYMLVWGRRAMMCKKPEGALPTDGMYSWTREILVSQLNVMMRSLTPREIPESCKRRPVAAKRSGS